MAFGNRTLYSKYERIDAALTAEILKEHLRGTKTIAAPILQNDRTNYLTIEYTGEDYQHFYHLTQHLFDVKKIKNYHIYQGRDKKHIQIFIAVNNLPRLEAEAKITALSDTLETRLTKQWKCLPTSTLPEEYNIIDLPCKSFDIV